MAEQMNIFQKLVEVRKAVPYLKKENSGYQFNYVSSSQVLGNLKQRMDELGVLLMPKVVGKKVTIDTYEKTDAKGNVKRTVDYFTELDMTFTWINADSPEQTIECPWYGQGIDTAGEKGVGKALTYAEKYFMLKFFNIPTDKDDPDSFQEKMGIVAEISEKSIKAIHAMRNDLKKTEDELKQWISKVLGREITSLKQITEPEAESIKKKLNTMVQKARQEGN